MEKVSKTKTPIPPPPPPLTQTRLLKLCRRKTVSERLAALRGTQSNAESAGLCLVPVLNGG